MFNVRLSMLAAVLIVLGGAAGLPLAGQAPREGITREQVLDNDKVDIARVRIERGVSEVPHTHPFDSVLVLMAPARVEMSIADQKTSEMRETGYVWYVPRGVTHYAGNLGDTTLQLLRIAVK
jgi:quercetin dioxygenase-like cupin family protein